MNQFQSVNNQTELKNAATMKKPDLSNINKTYLKLLSSVPSHDLAFLFHIQHHQQQGTWRKVHLYKTVTEVKNR